MRGSTPAKPASSRARAGGSPRPTGSMPRCWPNSAARWRRGRRRRLTRPRAASPSWPPGATTSSACARPRRNASVRRETRFSANRSPCTCACFAAGSHASRPRSRRISTATRHWQTGPPVCRACPASARFSPPGSLPVFPSSAASTGAPSPAWRASPRTPATAAPCAAGAASGAAEPMSDACSTSPPSWPADTTRASGSSASGCKTLANPSSSPSSPPPASCSPSLTPCCATEPTTQNQPCQRQLLQPGSQPDRAGLRQAQAPSPQCRRTQQGSRLVRQL